MTQARPGSGWPHARGEMADRIRAFDWAGTPLGPAADWPAGLRTTVELMLAVPQIASLAVGSERLFLYNDLASLHYGAAHPGALGQPLAAVFAHEFDEVASFYDRVFAGQSIKVPAQPLDPAQTGTAHVFDAYLTPVLDDEGRVIAAMMTGIEIAPRLRAETALRESEELRRIAIEGGGMGTWRWDLREELIWGDPVFLGLWGLPPSDEPRPLSDFTARMSPQGQAEMGEMVTRAVEAGEVFDGQLAVVSGPTQGRWVRWRGCAERDRPWIVDGVSFDVTKQRQRDDRTREREERQALLLKFSDALRAEDGPEAVGDKAVRMIAAKLALDRAYFVTAHLEEGRISVTHEVRRDDMAPMLGNYTTGDFPNALKEFLERPIIYTDVRSDTRLSDKDRLSFTGLGAAGFAAVPIRRGSTGLIWAVGAVCTEPRKWSVDEITFLEEMAERTWAAIERARAVAALRESEERQAFLLSFSDALRPLAASDEIERTATRLLGEHLKADRCYLSPVYDDGSGMCVREEYLRGDASSVLGDYTFAQFGDFVGPTLHAGQILAVEDVDALSGLDPAERESYATVGIGAYLLIPLVRDGRLAAFLTINHQTPRTWSEADKAVARQVADRLWIARERGLTDAALRESEERYRLLFETIDEGFCLCERVRGEPVDFRYLVVNPAFDRQSGLDHPVGKTIREIVPGIEESTMLAYARVEETGEPEHFTTCVAELDQWFDVETIPAGQPGRIAMLFRNVTERKRAEAALRESEERLQTLMEGVPQLVWRAVDGGHWTWASPQWTEFTGQPEGDSHDFGWLDPVHPDDREHVKAVWSGAIERGEFHADYRICNASQHRYIWFQTRATPVRNDRGDVVEWLGTSTDVDDIRTLQERQKVLVAELQHRVRNVLTVVRSVFARTVDAGGDIEALADHFRGRLDALARTQVVMTQNPEQKVDLENLIRDELLSVGAHDGANVTIDGPDVALSAKTAESIGLAIHELTTNAVKYGALSQRGPTLSITWTVNISDRGARRLVLTWREQGVPAISLSPARYGFGRELIEEALPYRLGAETELTFRGGGVSCSITLPLPDEGAFAADTS